MDQEQSSIGSPGVPPGDPVAAAFAQIRSGAQALIHARHWAASDTESSVHVEEGLRLKAMVEAACLVMIADLDERDDAVEGARPGQGAAMFLRDRCRRSAPRASADVRAARALKEADQLADRCSAAGRDTAVPAGDLDELDGVERNDLAGLPRLGLAFRAGQVSREHVDAAVRAVGQVGKALLDELDPDTGRSGRQRADDLLTDHARTFDPRTSEALAKELTDRLDPDGTRSFDPDGHLRRQFSMTTHADGMTSVRGQLDPASAAVVKKAIEHYANPLPTHTVQDEDGDVLPIIDTRSRGQRYADSLTAICRTALAAPDAGVRGGEPAHVTVHTTMEELQAVALSRPGNESPGNESPGSEGPAPARAVEQQAAVAALSAHQRAAFGAHSPQLTSLTPELLARLACDAIIDTVVRTRGGAVLDLGRSSRTHNAAQRRAVIARDRGCICCGAPPERCQLHHVRWWSEGGPTDLINLALLCDADHTRVHLGIYDVRMRDGVPWIRPPAGSIPSDAGAERDPTSKARAVPRRANSPSTSWPTTTITCPCRNRRRKNRIRDSDRGGPSSTVPGP